MILPLNSLSEMICCSKNVVWGSVWVRAFRCSSNTIFFSSCNFFLRILTNYLQKQKKRKFLIIATFVCDLQWIIISAVKKYFSINFCCNIYDILNVVWIVFVSFFGLCRFYCLSNTKTKRSYYTLWLAYIGFGIHVLHMPWELNET